MNPPEDIIIVGFSLFTIDIESKKPKIDLNNKDIVFNESFLCNFPALM